MNSHLKRTNIRTGANLIAVLFIAAAWAQPVRADAIISGPACVVDGNTLQVGGKVRDGKCWGGIDVRLHGSIARNLDVVCKDTGGRDWDCGKKARNALTRLIRFRSITCYHLDGEFDDTVPLVTCISGRKDLALEMVLLGMSEAAHDQTKRYELEEKDAKRARRGLWK